MSEEATASLGGAGCGSVVLHGNGAAMICGLYAARHERLVRRSLLTAWEVGGLRWWDKGRGDRRMSHERRTRH